ncbi:MAG: hypothetical protein IPL53_11300 [Ignavibacteria bacterium]|nr:hypothetical protein [Ignavibacteria bacterium]
MTEKFSKNIIYVLLILSIITINGCGNKDDQQGDKTKTGGKSGVLNSDFVVKSDSGTKVTLTIKPKKRDVFRYKMNALTTSKEKGPMTNEREITSTQDINYFYTEEVNDVVDVTGIITYKIKFDSINIVSTVSSADSSLKIIYNSNVKDSVYSKPDFIQYNSIMNEEFFARVSPKGEISEIYGLEKVYENMFKALGDTLTSAQKESLIFPVRNTLSYKLSEVKEENGQYLLKIDASLNADFLEKDIKEEKMSYKVENAETSGKGVINYNLSKGCVISKQTTTNINIDMKISAGGQSVKTKQEVATSLNILLLQ